MSRVVVKELIGTAFSALGITQTELAAQLGVDPATVNRWLKGRALPNASIVPRLAELLEISEAVLDVAIRQAEREETDEAKTKNRTLARQNAELRQHVLSISSSAAEVIGKVQWLFSNYEEMGHTYVRMDDRLEELQKHVAKQDRALAKQAAAFEARVVRVEALLEEILNRLGRGR